MTSPAPIRVLLVEDSPVALTVLQNILKAEPSIEVVGTAKMGEEALALIPKLDPQVICTDFHMPHMDGLALTQAVMDQCPRPILVLSISVQSQNTERIFQLLDAGAVDILAKPVAGLTATDTSINQDLINKIRILAGVKVFRKKKTVVRRAVQPDSQSGATQPVSEPPITIAQLEIEQSESKELENDQLENEHLSDQNQASNSPKPRVIGIGTSTGGPQALQLLLRQLPSNCPPVICVQHISVGFLPGLVNWLKQDCAADIRIAQAGDRPAPGRIYFAPSECHLTLDAQGKFRLLKTSPVDGHRPSITVMFESLAQYYGRRTVGILLTGMGQDGAEGLRQIREVGGFTIAQDEATSVVFGMPQVAIELGAAMQILPIDAIAPKLSQLLHAAESSTTASAKIQTFTPPLPFTRWED